MSGQSIGDYAAGGGREGAGSGSHNQVRTLEREGIKPATSPSIHGSRFGRPKSTPFRARSQEALRASLEGLSMSNNRIRSPAGRYSGGVPAAAGGGLSSGPASRSSLRINSEDSVLGNSSVGSNQQLLLNAAAATTLKTIHVLPKSSWISLEDGWFQATPSGSGSTEKMGLHSMISCRASSSSSLAHGHQQLRHAFLCVYEPRIPQVYHACCSAAPEYDLEVSLKLVTSNNNINNISISNVNGSSGGNNIGSTKRNGEGRPLLRFGRTAAVGLSGVSGTGFGAAGTRAVADVVFGFESIDRYFVLRCDLENSCWSIVQCLSAAHIFSKSYQTDDESIVTPQDTTKVSTATATGLGAPAGSIEVVLAEAPDLALKLNAFQDVLLQIRGGNSVSVDINGSPLFTRLRFSSVEHYAGLVGVCAAPGTRFAIKNWKVRGIQNNNTASNKSTGAIASSLSAEEECPDYSSAPAASGPMFTTRTDRTLINAAAPVLEMETVETETEGRTDSESQFTHLTAQSQNNNNTYNNHCNNKNNNNDNNNNNNSSSNSGSSKGTATVSRGGNIRDLVDRFSSLSSAGGDAGGGASGKRQSLTDLLAQKTGGKVRNGSISGLSTVASSASVPPPPPASAAVASTLSRSMQNPISFNFQLNSVGFGGISDSSREFSCALSSRIGPAYPHGGGGPGKPQSQSYGTINNANLGMENSSTTEASRSVTSSTVGNQGFGIDHRSHIYEQIAQKMSVTHERATVDSVMRDIVQLQRGGEHLVTYRDIASLETAKKLLHEAVVLPSIMPEFFTGIRSPWKGVLLFGPPGTGKTLLAKAVCSFQTNTTFFSCAASSLISKYRGDSEKIVRCLFETARLCAQMCGPGGSSVIFLDEVDALVSSRGNSSEHEASRRLKTEFFAQMDGLQASGSEQGANTAAGTGSGGSGGGSVMVLATTNCPWDLDEAMRRRLEKRIYIPLPDREARIQLFKICLRKIPVSAELGIDTVENGQEIPSEFISPAVELLADMTEGFSGSDVYVAVKEAAMMPMRRLLGLMSTDELAQMRNAGDLVVPKVMLKDLRDAVLNTTPSVSPDSLARYAAWERDFSNR